MIVIYEASIEYKFDIYDRISYNKFIKSYKSAKNSKITFINISSNNNLIREFANNFAYNGVELYATIWNDTIKYFIDTAESRGMRIRIYMSYYMCHRAVKYIMRPGWYRRICGFAELINGNRLIYAIGDLVLRLGDPKYCHIRLKNNDRLYVDVLEYECDYEIDAIYFTKSTKLYNCITFNGKYLMIGDCELYKREQLPFKIWLLRNRGLPKFIIVKILLLHADNLIWHENKLLFNY